MSKNNKGYRDPTADQAIGNVMKQQKRFDNRLKRRDGTPAADTKGGTVGRTWSDVLKEFEEIDKRKE